MKWLTISELSHGLDVETGVALAGVVLALAISMVATLVLFLSVKREAQRLALRERRRTEQRLEELKQGLEKIDRENQEARERLVYPELPAPTPGDQAVSRCFEGFGEEMGLAKRAQALKRLRAGEPLENVAREVDAPFCEIQLLARVEEHLREVRERSSSEPTGANAVASAGVGASSVRGTNPSDDRSLAANVPAPLTEDPRPEAIRVPARARTAKAGAGNE